MKHTHNIRLESPSQELSLISRPAAGSAGCWAADARLKLHISSAISKGEKIASLGSQGSNSGTVSRVSYWRTSCRIERNITSAQVDRTGKPIFRQLAERARGFNVWRWNRDEQSLDRHSLGQYSTEDIQKMSVGSVRGEIDRFSEKSRARLKFTAGNSFPHLISQFCLTYGKTCVPSDGRTTKKHLNLFLNVMRKKFSGLSYLWILEFQEKRKDAKAAHYHLFLPFEPDDQKRKWMAQRWVDIALPIPETDDYTPELPPALFEERAKMFSVHNNEKNFITWDMGKGSYLTKYLTKERQKDVPEGFENVGRFWGASRGLVPDAEVFQVEKPMFPLVFTDKLTGEVHQHEPSAVIVRYLRRHHEAQLRSIGIKRQSRVRKTYLSKINLPSGGRVINEYLRWYERERDRLSGPVPF